MAFDFTFDTGAAEEISRRGFGLTGQLKAQEQILRRSTVEAEKVAKGVQKINREVAKLGLNRRTFGNVKDVIQVFQGRGSGRDFAGFAEIAGDFATGAGLNRVASAFEKIQSGATKAFIPAMIIQMGLGAMTEHEKMRGKVEQSLGRALDASRGAGIDPEIAKQVREMVLRKALRQSASTFSGQLEESITGGIAALFGDNRGDVRLEAELKANKAAEELSKKFGLPEARALYLRKLQDIQPGQAQGEMVALLGAIKEAEGFAKRNEANDIYLKNHPAERNELRKRDKLFEFTERREAMMSQEWNEN